MKKAFTLLELVFVIVIIGILAAVIIPRTDRNSLHEAAIQLVSHIKYTQHLAMIDDKYDGTGLDDEWYKTRWQIFFANTNASDDKWSYAIFSDSAGSHTGNPTGDEYAKNPLNKLKYLTGGYGAVDYNDDLASKKLNLGLSYGVEDITFSANCSGSSLRISFDTLGRPFYNGSHLLDGLYLNGTTNQLITSQCIITLIDSSARVRIAVEAETGYTHIL